MGENSFSFNGYMTREQFVVMLYGYEKKFGQGEYEGNLTLSFKDNEEISSWAEEATAWCVANDIVGGRDTGNFNQKAAANRAEVATVLKNFLTIYD